MSTGDQTNAGGDQSYRVAITPTWETVAKISIEALLNGTKTGQSMAREEIVDLGIKLDDAKEIIEGQEGINKGTNLVPLRALQGAINDKNKIILDESERALEMERQLNKQALALAEYSSQAGKDLEYIQELEAKLEEKDQIMANHRRQIKTLEEFRSEDIKYWDERNVQQAGLPGAKSEDPIHEKILDLILESEMGKRNKLTDVAMDLVGVRELITYTINQQIKHNETYGEDTSIDEQSAEYVPHREGDE